MTKQINYLDDRGKVRNKIGIWLGSNTHQAVIHTVKELTSNSGDLLLEGIGSQITWILHDEKTIEICDDCTGIPIEGDTIIKKSDTKGNQIEEIKSNYELLLLTLFAGTKHNGLATGERNTGTNGVFNTVLTYSAEFVEYEIGRPNGNIYHCSFKEGFADKDLEIIGKTDKTYTKIKYKLSDQVYTENHFKFDEVCDICKKQSGLLSKPITIIDLKNNKQITYNIENIEELFECHLNTKTKDCEILCIEDKFSENITFEGKDYIDNVRFKMLLSYTKEEENNMVADFLNRSELMHHGTIYDGIIEGLKRSFHKFITEKGLYAKKETNISKDDVLCGLNYIMDFTSLHPNMFSNQTKFETKVEYFKTNLITSILKYFEIFAIENKEDMLIIANKLLLNKRSREKAETNRGKIRKELEEKANSVTSRPLKFVPCRSKIPSQIDFIVIEGDSSLNSVKLGRDPSCMCIQPLKGKPINPFKNKLDDLLKNQEVLAMFKVLGCGMEYNKKSIKGIPKFNIDNLQVDKLLIATDFDTDGYHIQSLLIGIFYTLAAQLLEQGKIYILYTPLYIIRTKIEIEYKGEKTKELLAYSDGEKNIIVKMLNDKKISFIDTRFKGLGGLPVSTMSKSLNKNTRILKQITMQDIEECKKWIELFLTEERLKERKVFIETYGKEYFDYSLFE